MRTPSHLKPEDLVEALGTIASGREKRATNIFVLAEDEYFSQAEGLRGFTALLNANLEFFSRTCAEMNVESNNASQPKDLFAFRIFCVNIVNAFHALRAAQITAYNGYPLQAFTILRNVFDSLLCDLAVVRNLATYHSLAGLDEKGQTQTEKELRSRRKKIEFSVRDKIVGKESGLSQQTVDLLESLNQTFDMETHGARLSSVRHMKWLKGESSLKVLPNYDQDFFSLYMNRHCEIGWMFHRLLPALQLSGFSTKWATDWATIDDAFRQMVEGLTLQLGKPLGMAISEFVNAKFGFEPLNRSSM